MQDSYPSRMESSAALPWTLLTLATKNRHCKQGPFDTSTLIYRGADKSLAQPDWKKQLKRRHFSSDAEIVAAAETWLDGRPSELFLSGLQMLEFGRCSLFPAWSG